MSTDHKCKSSVQLWAVLILQYASELLLLVIAILCSALLVCS